MENLFRRPKNFFSKSVKQNMRSKMGLLRIVKNPFILPLLIGVVGLVFSAPDQLEQKVTYEGETITLQLTKVNLRGKNFELWVQNGSGDYDVVTPVQERSYIGTVAEYPGALSCGIMQDDGKFRGGIYFDRGVQWFSVDEEVFNTRGLRYDDFTDYRLSNRPSALPGKAGTDVVGFDLGIDAPYAYYSQTGKNVAETFEAIEYSVSLIRGVYLGNAMIRPYLGRVIIRSDQGRDPFNGINDYTGHLDKLKPEWNNNHSDANSDLVAGLNPSFAGAGLAFIGEVATNNGYSSNGSFEDGRFDAVARHEMGHNWGIGHYPGGNPSPEGQGIMGGNDQGRFSGVEVNIIHAERDEKISSLDKEGPLKEVDIPPYAALDVPIIKYVSNTSHEHFIDVLANDFDANNHKLRLVGSDSKSSQGATVKVASDVSSEGRGVISYTTNYSGQSGLDWFHYEIEDEKGNRAKGLVTVNRGTTSESLKTLSTSSSNGTISLSPLARKYATGTEVTIEAIPEGSNIFQGWGGDLSGLENPTTITMNADKNITANFQVVGVEPLAGQKFLNRVYPNPSTHFVNIDFKVPASVNANSGNVNIQILDIKGRFVETIVDEQFTVGDHKIHHSFQNARLKPGVYYIQIKVGSSQQRQKIIKLAS